ncbi:hypothetical protein Tco_1576594 [Tanacetum coccineum]
MVSRITLHDSVRQDETSDDIEGTSSTDILILMVDYITFDREMVNILVSGEAYDKVFNHLDMLHAPLEGKMFNDVKLQVDYECKMAFELLRLVKRQLKEGYVP